MSGPIESGKRYPVQFGSYSGGAGVCIRSDGQCEVAFVADMRGLRKITAGTINGVDHTVRSVSASMYVPGMVVLTVTETTS